MVLTSRFLLKGALLTLVMLFTASAALAAPVPIDLGTWTQEGTSGNGNWIVATGGASVNQTINGDPTFFVSPGNYINTTFNGKFKVNTTSDDDFIGFVFGYNSPLDNDVVNDFDFFLFDWKQGDQSWGGYLAYEGFTLSRVNGTITDYGPGFWGHTDNPPAFDVLDTDYGSTRGWADNTEYEFTLLYQTNRIKIDIKGGTGDFVDGQTIFDVTPGDVGLGAFQDGRFGFYNYSQSNVNYQGFTEEEAPAVVPLPAAAWLLGSGLLGLVGLRRRFQG